MAQGRFGGKGKTPSLSCVVRRGFMHACRRSPGGATEAPGHAAPLQVLRGSSGHPGGHLDLVTAESATGCRRRRRWPGAYSGNRVAAHRSVLGSVFISPSNRASPMPQGNGLFGMSVVIAESAGQPLGAPLSGLAVRERSLPRCMG